MTMTMNSTTRLSRASLDEEILGLSNVVRQRRQSRHLLLLLLLLLFLWATTTTTTFLWTATAATTTTTLARPPRWLVPTTRLAGSRERMIAIANAKAALFIARGGATSTATSTSSSISSSSSSGKKKRKKKSSTVSTSRTPKQHQTHSATATATSKKDSNNISTTSTTSTQTRSSSRRSKAERKVRHIIRSLLDSTHSTGAVHKVIYQMASWLETLWGTSLLPAASSASSSSKTKKKNKQKNKKPQQSTATKSNKKSTTKTSTSQSINNNKAKTKTKTQSANYRIQRELKAFLQEPPEHLSVKVGKNIRIWIVTMQGLGIYQGETFQLRIQFPPNYPLRPPSVYFLPPHIPVHEHVYTNGDICLSLLGKDWRPTMTAQSIAHSILSILASATRKTKPMDNARHAHNKPGEYQEAWVYHDDSC